MLQKRAKLWPDVLCGLYAVFTYLWGSTIIVGVYDIERMQSLVQQPCKFIRTKESVYTRKELNYHRIGLVQQHGHCFIVLEH